MKLPNAPRNVLKLLGVALTLSVLAACADGVTQAPELETASHLRAGNFIALKGNNKLLLFSSERSRNGSTTRQVNGVDGTLLGIDYRPANGLLYGATSSKIYTIDPASGRATLVSTLSTPFGGGVLSGFDFNPVADRLRLTGTNDQSYRVDVDTGAVTVDGTLRYAQGDPNQGKNPSITGSAYTNSVAGATTTELYGVDHRLDVLVTQNPPNDGVLVTDGSLGVDFGNLVGFNIVAERDNTGYAVTNGRLYRIDLESGRAVLIKRLPDDKYRGLAVIPG